MEKAAKDNNVFYKPHVLSSHCNIGGESYLEASKHINYDDRKRSQADGVVVSCLGHLSKNSNFQHDVPQRDFLWIEELNLCVFDLRYVKASLVVNL